MAWSAPCTTGKIPTTMVASLLNLPAQAGLMGRKVNGLWWPPHPPDPSDTRTGAGPSPPQLGGGTAAVHILCLSLAGGLTMGSVPLTSSLKGVQQCSLTAGIGGPGMMSWAPCPFLEGWPTALPFLFHLSLGRWGPLGAIGTQGVGPLPHHISAAPTQGSWVTPGVFANNTAELHALSFLAGDGQSLGISYLWPVGPIWFTLAHFTPSGEH